MATDIPNIEEIPAESINTDWEIVETSGNQ